MCSRVGMSVQMLMRNSSSRQVHAHVAVAQGPVDLQSTVVALWLHVASRMRLPLCFVSSKVGRSSEGANAAGDQACLRRCGPEALHMLI